MFLIARSISDPQLPRNGVEPVRVRVDATERLVRAGATGPPAAVVAVLRDIFLWLLWGAVAASGAPGTLTAAAPLGGDDFDRI
jgi:hypothetical protein